MAKSRVVRRVRTPRSGAGGRFMSGGSDGLSTGDLLGMVIGESAGTYDRHPVADRILAAFGGIDRLQNVSAAGIARRARVRSEAALRAAAGVALAVRITEDRVREERPMLNSARAVDQFLRPRLCAEKQEVFYALLLDIKLRFLKLVEIARGRIASCNPSPGLILRAALVEAAPCMMGVHNHPSGDPTPSAEDERITRLLKETCAANDIGLVDHVIIGSNGYTSFADRGLLR